MLDWASLNRVRPRASGGASRRGHINTLTIYTMEFIKELAEHGRTIVPNIIASELYAAAAKMKLRVRGGAIIEGEHELMRVLYIEK